MAHEPIVLKTLGDLEARSFRFWISCTRCDRPPKEVLDDLIDRHGADREYMSLRFRCDACGAPGMVSLSRPQ